MSDFRKVGNLVRLHTKGITPKYVATSNVMVLNQKCIRNNKIDYSFAQYTEDAKKIPKNKIIQKGDILINSTGQGTAGRCAFVDKLPDGITLIADSHILLLRCGSYEEAQCLSYNLYSFEKNIQSFIDGSTGQGELDKVRLFNIQVPIPLDSKAQKQIANLLYKIDSKIELNSRINAELEDIAKTLYDYWFVQFDFPNAEGKPYKSSGGEMVWNEKLKRKIPVKWDIKCLGEITNVSTESLNPMNSPYKEFKLYSIPTFDKSGTFKIEKGEEIKSNKFTVKNTDVLVSKLNPWFSRVIYSTDDNDLICSTEFVVWRTKNIAIKNYIYTSARDTSFVTHCTQSATGTSNSHKRVNPIVMMKYQIAYDEKIAELFGNTLDSTIKMYANNQIENNNLSELRDWLLPMLMNGQVTVNES